MRIGIFLGYGPQVKLGKEGLGRYIGGLIKGFQEQNHEVTIAYPYWLNDSLNDLLNTFSVNKDKIQFIATKDNPPLWRVFNLISKPVSSKTFNNIILKKIKSILKYIGRGLAESKTFLDFSCFCILGIVFISVSFVPFLCLKIFLLIKSKLNGKKDKIKYVLSSRIGISSTFDWRLFLFRNMTNKVILKIIGMINKSSKVDIWFVPSLFWPQIKKIKGTVAINAPDLVSSVFPHGFANVYNSEYAIEDCRSTISNGKYFITYCEYLRRKLFEEEFVKNESCTISIPHSNNDMSEYIYIDDSLSKQLESKNDWTDVFAKQILTYLAPSNVKYIFYASQYRPNKNIMNLVKAFEFLVRRKFIGYKLYITAGLTLKTDVGRYIEEHNLENDIKIVFNVPAQTLAALYHCADLVVNPTLYEGGFPFTFGEGMSVGTPSIMSDIPQVRDVLEPAGLEDIMFDPYDWHAIADKIEWALSDLEGLYQKELPLYQEMEKRTYSVVAAEYVDAFKKFIELDEHNKDTI